MTIGGKEREGKERKGGARNAQQSDDAGKSRGGRGKDKAGPGDGRTRRGAARDANPPRVAPYRPPANNRPGANTKIPERPPAQRRQLPPGSSKPSRTVKPFEPTEEARQRLAELQEKRNALEATRSAEVVMEEETPSTASGAIRLDIEQTRAIALEQKKHRERLARIHRLIELAGLLERHDSNEALAALQQGELDRHERVLASWRAKIGDRAVHRALRIADGH